MKITCALFASLCLCAFSDIRDTSVIVKKFPYGPKMCKLLGERTVGCTYATFDPFDLSCKEWTGSMRKSPPPGVVIQITQRKEKMFNREKCPTASTVVEDRAKTERCVTNRCFEGSGSHMIFSPRHCYVRRKRSLTWASARTACKREGSDLISLDTKQKYKQAQDYMSRLNLPYYRIWVGMSRKPYTTIYRWLSGKRKVAKWHSGDPNYGDELCVMLVDKGLADSHCDHHREFICEISHSKKEK